MNTMHIFFYWIALALILLLLEAGHPGLFFFSAFSIGALSAAFASIWIYSWVAQCSIFLAATVCALCILRYWVAHYVHKGQEHYHSNIYALIGKRAVVITEITSIHPGRIKIDGDSWVARSINAHETIDVGSVVEIVQVSGSHVKVKQTAKE
jgi:membrane protein implicated in regulation of membrane protease activity